MNGNASIIVLFRRTLRVSDNEALFEASKRNLPIIPIYVYDRYEHRQGAAAKWWLHRSLVSLDESFRALGLKLVIRKGELQPEVSSLAKESNCSVVYWSRSYDPEIKQGEDKLEAFLQKKGIQVQTFNSTLLIEPKDLKNKQGKPYQVYTPFSKSVFLADIRKPFPIPRDLKRPRSWPKSIEISKLGLKPKIRWDKGLLEVWNPGEAKAQEILERFSRRTIKRYNVSRDFPAVQGTSKLAPYIHFGEISPQQVWWRLFRHMDQECTKVFLKQLIWREFAYYLLQHFPYTERQPLRKNFEKFPWNRSKKMLRAWQQGQTGYPIVDAGMRELWHTGWMHNRVRMIVASFLTKDLFVNWTEGAKWFWDTLVDADLANNTMGWQWVAGCGADAAPYFRIFNPVLQGERFDPTGDYVKKWIPELAALEPRYVHQPWEAPKVVLDRAGICLGRNYPNPLIDHNECRHKAMTLYYRYLTK